ncbi:unnamed protein product [marine sediment metagenome]|uniref:Uncharacterized protein n=1 Tax=marine sediment metagenome TaxID=412755 RepID=X0WQU1_9ZZZZ
MEKTRILITDETESSKKVLEILREIDIQFTEIRVGELSQTDFLLPTLIAPEGRFEGEQLVQVYAKAEKNGFHKKIEFNFPSK